MLSILVSSCKNISLYIKDLWTWDICIVCYWVYLSWFKCIRNTCDSVKFLCDVMLLLSALGCAGCLWPGWPVGRTCLTGLSCVLCWLVLTGLLDRSDRSGVAALQFCLSVCFKCHIASRVRLCCSHTLFAPHRYGDLGGVFFVLNMCNLACEANLWWIPFICIYWGGAPTKSENQMFYWISFCKL